VVKTVHEHLRDHLLASELERTEWDQRFEQYMRNRLVIGALRYARLHDQNAPAFNSIENARERLALYLQDGNQEHLVDAANLCMIEFCRPTREAHFSPDSDHDHHAKIVLPNGEFIKDVLLERSRQIKAGDKERR
jgi:hypothetical protein